MKRNLSKNIVSAFAFLSLFLGCTPMETHALYACRTRPILKEQDQEHKYPFPKSVRSLPQASRCLEYSDSDSSDGDSSIESGENSDQSNSPLDSSFDEDTFDEPFSGQTLSHNQRSLIRVSHLITLSTSLMAKNRFDEARSLIEKFYDDNPDQTLYFLHLLCGINVHMNQTALELFMPQANQVLKHLPPTTHILVLSTLLEHQKVCPLEDLIEGWNECATSPHHTVKLDWLQALAGLAKEERTHLTHCTSSLSLHSFVCGRAAQRFRQIQSTDWDHAVDVTTLLGINQNDGARAEYIEIISTLAPNRWDPLVQSFCSISFYFKPAVLPSLIRQLSRLTPKREKQVVNTISVIGRQSLPLSDISFMQYITTWTEAQRQALQKDLLAFEPGRADFPSIFEPHRVKYSATIKQRKKESKLKNDSPK